MDGCVRPGIPCTAITTSTSGAGDGNATWAVAYAGDASAQGTCLVGYSGTPTRSCSGTATAPGTWGAVVDPCTGSSCVHGARGAWMTRGSDAQPK